MSLTTPGVVERASKEISRRIHSLGFKTSSKRATKDDQSSTSSTESGDGLEGDLSVQAGGSPSVERRKTSAKQLHQQQLSETDRLNGNSQQQQQSADDAAETASPTQPPQGSQSPSVSGYRNMGSIIKGSVMDKVTNVFSGGSSNMGNTNHKDISSGHAAVATAAGGGGGSTSASAAATGNKGVDSDSTNVINIPKGAVANGRAKFESAQKNSPEKPMRLFGSRSRTNSPMLPVRTPKVPSQPTAAASAASGNSPPSADSAKNNASGRGNNNNVKKDKSLALATIDQNKSPSVTSKFLPKMKKFTTWQELWRETKFLLRFFSYFTSAERCLLAQVSPEWRDILYGHPEFWREVRPVLHCRDIRSWSSAANSPVSVTTSTTSGSISNGANLNASLTSPPPPQDTSPSPCSATETTMTSPSVSVQQQQQQQLVKHEALKQNYFNSLKMRGFDTFCLLNANDADIFDFIQNFPHGAKHIHALILRCCNISDRGLEALMEFLQALYKLEIAGCNEITEQGLWSSLHPRLVSLTINDCINVADECVCAVTQLLPALYEFNLQAYHVTDSALSYFSPKQTGTLNILRLQSCWEITNHGIVNIVHTLPNLTVLSLSGCSKITDDGIELIAENLRKLRSLDISWCPRVTDAALEYIACDLNNLEELTLDRCVHITDIGIGYISTMLALHTLYLRWCTQIRDFGLQHICGMRSMQILSLAGCSLLTSSGLSNLIQLRHLQELELTNCPGATPELIEYLRQNLQKSLVLD